MLPGKPSYLLGLCALAGGTILQNGQVRPTNYPDTKVDISSYDFRTYEANATELSYKGRWDSKKVSWWSSPGLVFGFTGDTVAITFGELTTNATLVAYRIGGLDWAFTNVTAGATHLLVSSETPGVNETFPISPLTFELRVTNWIYGVQIDKVHVAAEQSLVKVPPHKRTIEFIGDSLTVGMYTTYEGLSSFAYAVGAGFGQTEYYVTAFPGLCVTDQSCWGIPRGQSHQWFYTSDIGWRSDIIWGDEPEPWDFKKQETIPDIVVINLGTNDIDPMDNVTTEAFIDGYKKLISGVHGKYPKAHVIVMELWLTFYSSGNSYEQKLGYQKELKDIMAYFNSREYLSAPTVWDGTTNTTTTLHGPARPFVHYFSTKGILQHSDISPEDHPSDIGAVKIASHLMQFIKLTFGWEMLATGPEVLHDTMYWNDEPFY
ncbi:SGNH hydrolase-type esterase domain-containing protein [Hypoxylon sp. NC1633]|nr:SGNH hydrolase-type esterase domain-containing protein [Hypoxylon sp. NC1633]